MRMLAIGAATALLMLLVDASSGHAATIRVDWQASIAGGAGNGVVSGSLGEFEVATGTEQFSNLFFVSSPAIGDPVDVSGLSVASRNGAYQFAAFNGSTGFRFTSFASGELYVPFGSPLGAFFYTKSGTLTGATVRLMADTSTTDDTDRVIFCVDDRINGCDPNSGSLNGNVSSVGTPVFSFTTVVPEPSTALLTGLGLLGLAVRRRTH